MLQDFLPITQPWADHQSTNPSALREINMDCLSIYFILMWRSCCLQDSPINKQLYAKEIPTYKKMVQDYYKEIKEQPPVSDQDVSAYIAEISRVGFVMRTAGIFSAFAFSASNWGQTELAEIVVENVSDGENICGSSSSYTEALGILNKVMFKSCFSVTLIWSIFIYQLRTLHRCFYGKLYVGFCLFVHIARIFNLIEMTVTCH